MGLIPGGGRSVLRAPVESGEIGNELLKTSNYLGYFRIPSAGGFTSHRGYANYISKHPDPTKLFFAATSGSSIKCTVLTLPNLLTLKKTAGELSSADFAAKTTPVDMLPTYLADTGYAVGNGWQIASLQYVESTDKLWIQMKQVYNVSYKVNDTLASYTTDGSFTRIDTLRHPNPPLNGQFNGVHIPGAEESELEGAWASTEGSLLESAGWDFVCTPGWSNNSHGPRLSVTKLLPAANEYGWNPCVQHDTARPEIGYSTNYYSHQPGVFTDSQYCFPIRRGDFGGWYGEGDGYNANKTSDRDEGTLLTRIADDEADITRTVTHIDLQTGDFVRLVWGSTGNPATREFSRTQMEASVSGGTINLLGGTGDVMPSPGTPVHMEKFLAYPTNTVPDPYSSSQGYHAPPYHAVIYRINQADMLDSISGAIDWWEVPAQVEDVSSFMIRENPNYNSIGGMCEHDGKYFVVEDVADTLASPFNDYCVIHVWNK